MNFNPSEHLMDLKGKKYLQVAWRLVWFREEKPLWTINTSAVEMTDDRAIFRSEIQNEEGRVVSTGYGSETQKDFQDFIEKAETKSVGRALAMLGYGTQFSPDLDEGERIVDSPIEIRKKLTEPQVKRAFAIAKSKGYNAEEVKTWAVKKYKVSAIEDLTKEQYDEFCVRMESMEPKGLERPH